MAPVGINNGNSQHARLEREYLEPKPTLREIVERPITRAELELLADKLAAKYQVVLFHRIEVQIRTIEADMKAVVEWADQMAEVLQ